MGANVHHGLGVEFGVLWRPDGLLSWSVSQPQPLVMMTTMTATRGK
jgi:hypothetical protein